MEAKEIRATLENCLNALDSLTVTGRHNCLIVTAVSNDLIKLIEKTNTGGDDHGD